MVMSMENRAVVATEVMAHRHEIANYATDQTYQSAFWQLRYGDNGRVTCLNDNLKNIEVVSLAIRNASPMIMDTHVQWLRDLYTNLGLCSTFLAQSFVHMQSGAKQVLSAEAAALFGEEIDRARKALAHRSPICRELIRHQDAITEVVVDAMYRHTPYWSIRFGDAGRQSCMIDTYYNIAFMADALETNNYKGIQIHTRWMRDFLISRGMCSRYYLDAWHELTEAVIAVLSPEHHPAVRNVFKIVTEAVKSTHDFAVLIDFQQDQLIEAVTQAHYDRQPALQGRMARAAYKRDVLFRLSYMVDAVHHKKPQIFSDHITWVQASLLHLNMTPQDLSASLSAIRATLPQGTPPEVYTWLQPQAQAAGPVAQAVQASARQIADTLTQKLYTPNTLWHYLSIPEARQAWPGTLQNSVEHLALAVGQGDIKPVLNWLLKSAQKTGGSRAFLITYVSQLRQAVTTYLVPDVAQTVQLRLDEAMNQLTDEDPALALLQITDLTVPIVDSLHEYSPYWQVNYARRSPESISEDIAALIGLLADDLMELTEMGFPAAADRQRHYLLTQGICTAYYQQMLDSTLDRLQQVLDSETIGRATMVIDAANATLEDNAQVMALANVQDTIVSFVIDYLRQSHPDWVNHYPGGWESATTDMYYWLGYLTDAVTLNKPDILASHIRWLYDYAAKNGGSGEHIRLSLIALGHAIKTHLPDHAAALLNTMRSSLAKISP